jgi:hypothetical protein
LIADFSAYGTSAAGYHHGFVFYPLVDIMFVVRSFRAA